VNGMPLEADDTKFRVAFEASTSGVEGLNSLVVAMERGEKAAEDMQGKVLSLRETINHFSQTCKDFTHVLATMAVGGNENIRVLSNLQAAAQLTLEKMASYQRLASAPTTNSTSGSGGMRDQLLDASFKNALNELSAFAQEVKAQQQQLASYRMKSAGMPIAALEELKALAAANGVQLGGGQLPRNQQLASQIASEIKEVLGEVIRQLPSARPYNQYTANPSANSVVDKNGLKIPGRKGGGSEGGSMEEVRPATEKMLENLYRMEQAGIAVLGYFTRAAQEGGQLADNAVRRYAALSRTLLDEQARVRVFYERVLLQQRQVEALNSTLTNEIAYQLSQRGVQLPRADIAARLSNPNMSPNRLLQQRNIAIDDAEIQALKNIYSQEAQGRVAAMRSRVLSQRRNFPELTMAYDTEPTGLAQHGVRFNPATFVPASADPAVWQRTQYYSSQLGNQVRELFATGVPGLRGLNSVRSTGGGEAVLLEKFYTSMKTALERLAGTGQQMTVGAWGTGFDSALTHGRLGELGLGRFQDFYARNQGRVNPIGLEEPLHSFAALWAEQNPSAALGVTNAAGAPVFINKNGGFRDAAEMRGVAGWSNANVARSLGLKIKSDVSWDQKQLARSRPGDLPMRVYSGRPSAATAEGVIMHSARADAPISGAMYTRFANAYNEASAGLEAGQKVPFDDLVARITRGRVKGPGAARRYFQGLYGSGGASEAGEGTEDHRLLTEAQIEKNAEAASRVRRMDQRALLNTMLNSNEMLGTNLSQKLELINQTPNIDLPYRSALSNELLGRERRRMMDTQRGLQGDIEPASSYYGRNIRNFSRQILRNNRLANPPNPEQLRSDRDALMKIGATPEQLRNFENRIAIAERFLAQHPESRAIIDPTAATRLAQQQSYASAMGPFAERFGIPPLSSYSKFQETISGAGLEPAEEHKQMTAMMAAARTHFLGIGDRNQYLSIDAELKARQDKELSRRKAEVRQRQEDEQKRHNDELRARLQGASATAARSAYVFDIDKTLLSNSGVPKEGGLAAFHQWAGLANAEPIPVGKALYDEALASGADIHMITARGSQHREATIRNLQAAGMGQFTSLSMPPNPKGFDTYDQVAEFKAGIRRRLIESGVRIAKNIGDAETDFRHGYFEKGVMIKGEVTAEDFDAATNPDIAPVEPTPLSRQERLNMIRQRSAGRAGGISGSSADEASRRAQRILDEIQGPTGTRRGFPAPFEDERAAEDLRRRMSAQGESRLDQQYRLTGRVPGQSGASGADELGKFPFSGDLRARQAALNEQAGEARLSQARTQARLLERASIQRADHAKAMAAKSEENLAQKVTEIDDKILAAEEARGNDIRNRNAKNSDLANREADRLFRDQASANLRKAASVRREADLAQEKADLAAKPNRTAAITAELTRLDDKIAEQQQRRTNIDRGLAAKEFASESAAKERREKAAAAAQRSQDKIDKLVQESDDAKAELAAKQADNAKKQKALEENIAARNRQRNAALDAADKNFDEQARLNRQKFAQQQVDEAERTFARRRETLGDIGQRGTSAWRAANTRVQSEMGLPPSRERLVAEPPPTQQRPEAPPMGYSPAYERYLGSISRYQDRIDASHQKLMSHWNEEEKVLTALRQEVDKMPTGTPEEQALKSQKEGLLAARMARSQEERATLQAQYDQDVEKSQAQAAKAGERYSYDFQKQEEAKTRSLEREYSRRKETLRDYAMKNEGGAVQGAYEQNLAEARAAMGLQPVSGERITPASQPENVKETAYKRYAAQVEKIDQQLAAKRMKYLEMEKEELESIAVLRTNLQGRMASGAATPEEPGYLAAREGQSRSRLGAQREALENEEQMARQRANTARENMLVPENEGGSDMGGALMHLGTLIAQYYALRMVVQGVMLSYVEYAARTEQMRSVTEQMARTNELNVTSIMQEVEAVRSLNITTQAAHETVQRMMFAQLDVRRATDLARLAQDASVISGEESSQALEKIITGITTGQTRILHYMGLMVSMQQVVREETERLGRAPTEIEKRQAMLNKVLEEGVKIQGNFDAAMLSSAQQMKLLSVAWQEAENAIGGQLQPGFLHFLMTLKEGAAIITQNADSFAKLAAAITAAVGAVSAYAVASVALKAGTMLAGSLNPWLAVPAALIGLGIYKGATKGSYEGLEQSAADVHEDTQVERQRIDAQYASGQMNALDHAQALARLAARDRSVTATTRSKEVEQLIKDRTGFDAVQNLRNSGEMSFGERASGFAGALGRMLPGSGARAWIADKLGVDQYTPGRIGANANIALDTIGKYTLGNLGIGGGTWDRLIKSNQNQLERYNMLGKFSGNQDFDTWARTELKSQGFDQKKIEDTIKGYHEAVKKAVDAANDPLVNMRLLVEQQAAEMEDDLFAAVRKSKSSLDSLKSKAAMRDIRDPLEKMRAEVNSSYEKTDIDDKADELRRAIGLLNIDPAKVARYESLQKQLSQSKYSPDQLQLLNKYAETASGGVDDKSRREAEGFLAGKGISKQQIDNFIKLKQEQDSIAASEPGVRLAGNLADIKEYQDNVAKAKAIDLASRQKQYFDELAADAIERTTKLQGEQIKLRAQPGIQGERDALDAEYAARIGVGGVNGGVGTGLRGMIDLTGATRENEKALLDLMMEQGLEQEKLNKKIRDMNREFEVSVIKSRGMVAETGIRAMTHPGIDQEVQVYDDKIKRAQQEFAITKDQQALRSADRGAEQTFAVNSINLIKQKIDASREERVDVLKMQFSRAVELRELSARNPLEQESASRQAFIDRLALIQQIKAAEIDETRTTAEERKKIEEDADKEMFEAKMDRLKQLSEERKKYDQEDRQMAGGLFDALYGRARGDTSALRNFGLQQLQSTGRTMFENFFSATGNRGLHADVPGQVKRTVDAQGNVVETPTFLGKLLAGTPLAHRQSDAERQKLQRELENQSPHVQSVDKNTEKITELNSLLDRLISIYEKGGSTADLGREIRRSGITGLDFKSPISPSTGAGPISEIPTTVDPQRISDDYKAAIAARQASLAGGDSDDSDTPDVPPAAGGAPAPRAAIPAVRGTSHNIYEQAFGPIADQMAAKYKINPDVFHSLIMSESGFNPNARNPKSHITGIAQFENDTAKEYGVAGNLDPTAQLDAAAHLYSDRYKKYGNDRATIASYKGVAAGGATMDDVDNVLSMASQRSAVRNFVPYGPAVPASAGSPGYLPTSNAGWDQSMPIDTTNLPMISRSDLSSMMPSLGSDQGPVFDGSSSGGGALTGSGGGGSSSSRAPSTLQQALSASNSVGSTDSSKANAILAESKQLQKTYNYFKKPSSGSTGSGAGAGSGAGSDSGYTSDGTQKYDSSAYDDDGNFIGAASGPTGDVGGAGGTAGSMDSGSALGGAGSVLGMVGEGISAGFQAKDALHQFGKGGAQGALGGAADILQIASMIPGPIGMVAGAAATTLQMIKMFMGDPRAAFQKAQEKRLKQMKYNDPDAIDQTMNTAGQLVDFNMLGQVRTGGLVESGPLTSLTDVEMQSMLNANKGRGQSVAPIPGEYGNLGYVNPSNAVYNGSNYLAPSQNYIQYTDTTQAVKTSQQASSSSNSGPGQTVQINVSTMDSRSFNDNSDKIANALRGQLMLNHPITNDIRQLSV
jgi:HAD superfamily, subfamily IIIB (Acid phosphatase)/Transglycosylase SLT domain